MEDRVALYEDMMRNVGKDTRKVWNEMAIAVLNESYMKDKAIYGSDTRSLYGSLFEDEALFEDIDEKLYLRSMTLNEQSFEGNYAEDLARGNVDTSIIPVGFDSFVNRIKVLFRGMGKNVNKYFSNGVAGVIANPWPLLTAGASAGAVAAVIALIRKFKKLSADKKAKALSKLSKENKAKAEAILAKDEAELKSEFEAKAKVK